jgi:hypothetical protein
MRKFEIINHENPEGESTIIVVGLGGSTVEIRPGRRALFEVDDYEFFTIGGRAPEADVLVEITMPAELKKSFMAPPTDQEILAMTEDELDKLPAAVVNDLIGASTVIPERPIAEIEAEIAALKAAETRTPEQIEEEDARARAVFDEEQEIERQNAKAREKEIADYAAAKAERERIEEETVDAREAELEALSFGALREIAAELGLKGRSKVELVAAIVDEEIRDRRAARERLEG